MRFRVKNLLKFKKIENSFTIIIHYKTMAQLEHNNYKEFLDFKNTHYKNITLQESPNNLGSAMIGDKYCVFNIHGIIHLQFDEQLEKEYYGKFYFVEKFLQTKYEIDHQKKFYDLNYNIIRDFPKKKLLKWLNINFESRKICYVKLLHIELVKFVFHIWRNNNDGEFSLHVQKIKNHLTEVANMNQAEYQDILNNKENPRYNTDKHYIYYTFWLYPYFVLLDNCEELIIKLINLVYLDDAEMHLLYGIYHMEPHKLAPFMKNFLLELWRQNKHFTKKACFGFPGQFAYLILKTLFKLYKNGYDLINDAEVRELFKYTTREGIEKNSLRRLDEKISLRQLHEKIQCYVDKIYTNLLDENKINSNLSLPIKRHVKQTIGDRILILNNIKVDLSIQEATEFIKNNKEMILKIFRSIKMDWTLTGGMLLVIEIRWIKNKFKVHEKLIFVEKYEEEKDEEKKDEKEPTTVNHITYTCIPPTHEINNLGEYFIISSLCFAEMYYDVNNDVNDNVRAPWLFNELTGNTSDHVCDICEKKITKGDFTCDDCEDFDICCDCKLSFETDIDKQNEIKDATAHCKSHSLSQKFIGSFDDCHEFDNYLCFAEFFL